MHVGPGVQFEEGCFSSSSKSQRTLPSRNKKRKQYSKGEINGIIDCLVHSLYKSNSTFIIIDATLHGIVEQNPQDTIRNLYVTVYPRLLE